MDWSKILRVIIGGTAWSFVGVIIAVLFFYWTEYRNPFDFKIVVESEVNLFEVKEKIEALRILYENDLLCSGKEIRIVNLLLKNDGNTILQQYYDEKQPFGVRFENSVILKQRTP